MSGRQNGRRTLDSLMTTTRCYICLDNFKDPRELDCCHIFCKTCLDGYIQMVCPDGQINCPLCNTVTATPQNGAEGIKKNLYLNLSQITVGITCDVCKDDQNAFGRCVECEQDMCHKCFSYHNSIASTREHHIATIGKDHLQGKLTRNLYCQIHVDEKQNYYCIDCEKLVCQHCNMTKHKYHMTRVTTEMSDNFREQLLETVDSEEYVNHVLWLTGRKNEVSQQVKNMEAAEDTAMKEINNAAKLWHGLIEDMRKELLKEVREEGKKTTAPVKNNVKKLDTNLQAFANVYLVAKTAAKQADDVEIVESGLKLMRRMRSLKLDEPVSAIKRNQFIQFSSNQMSASEFRPYFGQIGTNISTSKPKLLSQFCSLTEGAQISAISPVDDGRAWIVEGNQGLVQLYDLNGRVHQRFNVDLPADDLIRGQDNKMYVSCNSAKKVLVVDKDFQTSVLTSTSECARGLAYDSPNGTIIICLTEKNAYFDYENHHNNRVVKSIINGNRRMETPDILSYAGFPVVEYPARLAITKSGYIAISDWKRNCVVILDGTGHVETEYFSLRKADNLDVFCPRGICSDGNGRILVTDFNNHRVMLLDETGQTFHPVLTAENGIHHPWSVNCGVDESVWVGNKHGEVKVYSLNLSVIDKK